eukprot:COSAG03_NODE_901_length_5420_cov_4.340350_4_plen_138_part_00
MRERERERDRDRDRETDTHTHRERETEIETQRHRDTEIQSERQPLFSDTHADGCSPHAFALAPLVTKCLTRALAEVWAEAMVLRRSERRRRQQRKRPQRHDVLRQHELAPPCAVGGSGDRHHCRGRGRTVRKIGCGS